MEWEIFPFKFKSIHSFIWAEAEEGCILINVPLCWIYSCGAVICFNIVGYNIYCCMFFNFSFILQRPETGDQQICTSFWLKSNQIFNNSSVLHCGTTLLNKNSVVIWDVQKLLCLSFNILWNVSEFILSVAQLHDTLASSLVIKHAFLAFLQYCVRKLARTWREVISVSVISNIG